MIEEDVGTATLLSKHREVDASRPDVLPCTGELAFTAAGAQGLLTVPTGKTTEAVAATVSEGRALVIGGRDVDTNAAQGSVSAAPCSWTVWLAWVATD